MQLLNFLMGPSLAVAFVTFGHRYRLPNLGFGAIINHSRGDGVGTMAITIREGPVDRTGAEGKYAQVLCVVRTRT